VIGIRCRSKMPMGGLQRDAATTLWQDNPAKLSTVFLNLVIP
jgi:hypothetical protein